MLNDIDLINHYNLTKKNHNNSFSFEDFINNNINLRDYLIHSNVCFEIEFLYFFNQINVFNKHFDNSINELMKSIDNNYFTLENFTNLLSYQYFREIIINRIFQFNIKNKNYIISYDPLVLLNNQINITDNTNFIFITKQLFEQIIQTVYKNQLIHFAIETRTNGIKNALHHKTFKNYLNSLYNKKYIIYFILFLIFFKISITIFAIILLIYQILILFFKIFLFIMNINNTIVENQEIQMNNLDYFSQYNILVPIYKERKETIAQLIDGLNKISYPKYLLNIRLIIEADDLETIKNINSIKNIPQFIDIIKVPYFQPRTKPKALNYGILFTNCKYLTIYDAEDVPDTMQLKKAIHKFLNSSEDTFVVQSILCFYNKDYNLITQIFNIEYLHWFIFMLNSINKIKLLIPLGGTSNHFKFHILEKLYFWDAYNVTEDLELSIRGGIFNYKTNYIQSITREWCVTNITTFLKQRTRWIKGFILNYYLYFDTINNKKNIQLFCFFHLIVGSSALSLIASLFIIPIQILLYFINTDFISDILFYLKKFNYFHHNIIIINFNKYFIIVNKYLAMILYYIEYFSVIIFYIAIFISYLIVEVKYNKLSYLNIAHKKKLTILYKIFKTSVVLIFSPFYFILHLIATLFAFYEIFKRPFFWNKTMHNVGNFNKN